MEGSTIHDRQKNLATDIHKHHSAPFVWVGQITRLGNWDTLAVVPSLIVSFAFKKGINKFVDFASWFCIHSFVGFWWDAVETRTFSVLEFVNRRINFFVRDKQIEVVEGWTLRDISEDREIDRAVVVEYSFKMRAEDCHVFLAIGGYFAICHFHCHCDFLFVMISDATSEATNVFPGNWWV